jgi:STAS domain/NAD dependent epimerase/dehydratase family
MRNAPTGPTGFVGSHILTELHSQGHEVIPLVRDKAEADRFASNDATQPIPGDETSGNWDSAVIEAAISAIGSSGKPCAHISGGWAVSGDSGWDTSVHPALEIWIDEFTSPATIRLEGVLDRTTEGPFLRFIDELLLEGVRHLMIDAGAVEVGDVSGANALAKLRGRIGELGGSLTWEGLDFNQPRHRVLLPPSRAATRARTTSLPMRSLFRGDPFQFSR